MSANFSAWLGTTDSALRPATNEASRAALAWKRINDKPAAVAFRTPAGTTLAAQTVRIEFDSRSSANMGNAGTGGRRSVVVFGVKGHATVTDTDVKAGYRFVLNGQELRCIDVIETIGEVQGVFEES